jgi:hypothetical protein
MCSFFIFSLTTGKDLTAVTFFGTLPVHKKIVEELFVLIPHFRVNAIANAGAFHGALYNAGEL